MSLPFELVNLVFSFVGSETAPLIKEFVKEVGEKYRDERVEGDGSDGEFILDRDFFTASFVIGHTKKLLKNGKVFLWSSVLDYDEFYPEIFGDENRSGEEQLYKDYLEIVEAHSQTKNYYLGLI